MLALLCRLLQTCSLAQGDESSRGLAPDLPLCLLESSATSMEVYYVSPVLILASTLQQFAFKCVVRELPEIFNRKTDLHFNMLLKNFKISFFSVTSHYQRNGRHYRNYSYLGAILNS